MLRYVSPLLRGIWLPVIIPWRTFGHEMITTCHQILSYYVGSKLLLSSTRKSTGALEPRSRNQHGADPVTHAYRVRRIGSTVGRARAIEPEKEESQQHAEKYSTRPSFKCCAVPRRLSRGGGEYSYIEYLPGYLGCGLLWAWKKRASTYYSCT